MPPLFLIDNKKDGMDLKSWYQYPGQMEMFWRNVAVCLKRNEFDSKIITSYDVTWALAEYAEGREDYFVKHRNSKSEKVAE